MSKKFTRRDAVSIAGVGALAAGGAVVGAGIGQYLDEQNKSKAKSQAEAFNNPSESSVAELRQKTANIATEAPTTNPSAGSSSVPTDAAMSNEADGIEHLPDDTTPGLGEEPKSLNWREIPPMSLRIPRVWFNARTQFTGITYNAQTKFWELVIPVTYRIGVFDGSAPLTSDKGTTVMVGHVNWDNGAAAPMSAITACRLGDDVYTTDRDGVLTEWTVTQIVPDVPQTELSSRWNLEDKTGKRQLLMATCHGTYNPSTDRWSYTQNFVVIAEPKHK